MTLILSALTPDLADQVLLGVLAGHDDMIGAHDGLVDLTVVGGAVVVRK